MLRLLAAPAVAALFTTGAMAADLPLPQEPIPAAVPALYNWTGFYVGAQGGFAFEGENVWSPAPVTNDLEGFFAGGTVGANWQMNWFVVGAEADGGWAGIDG